MSSDHGNERRTRRLLLALQVTDGHLYPDPADVRGVLGEGTGEGLEEGLDHYEMLKVMRERVREVAADKIRLMDATGRARR
jgi:hypothetical protein